MSIVDDLIENLVERNTVGQNGTFTISLVDGGVRVKGQAFTSLRDQKKNKTLLNATVPVEAEVKVSPLVIPLPVIK